MHRILTILVRLDWLLLLSALLLSLIGLAAIGSVGLAHDPPTLSSVVKQAIVLALGVVAALALTVANYRALDHHTRTIYVCTFFLLVAVLIFGRTINGMRGWFVVGGWGFQPIEFAKITVVVVLSRLMSKHAHMRDRQTLLSAALLSGALVVLVLLQPDFGGALLLLGLWFTLLLLAGVRRSHLFALIGAGLAIALIAWFFVLRDYQKERLRTFVDPSRAQQTRSYNITQAKIAIGAGGLFGRGLGFGSQSQLRFVPEAQSDFVLAVIGEELGFVGVGAALGLFFLFFLRALKLALTSNDNFTLFLTVGLATQILLAVAVNAGMNLGLLPVTGIALPFVSAGGSSLLAAWITVGLLQSVAVRSAASSAESGVLS